MGKWSSSKSSIEARHIHRKNQSTTSASRHPSQSLTTNPRAHGGMHTYTRNGVVGRGSNRRPRSAVAKLRASVANAGYARLSHAGYARLSHQPLTLLSTRKQQHLQLLQQYDPHQQQDLWPKQVALKVPRISRRPSLAACLHSSSSSTPFLLFLSITLGLNISSSQLCPTRLHLHLFLAVLGLQRLRSAAEAETQTMG